MDPPALILKQKRSSPRHFFWFINTSLPSSVPIKGDWFGIESASAHPVKKQTIDTRSESQHGAKRREEMGGADFVSWRRQPCFPFGPSSLGSLSPSQIYLAAGMSFFYLAPTTYTSIYICTGPSDSASCSGATSTRHGRQQPNEDVQQKKIRPREWGVGV